MIVSFFESGIYFNNVNVMNLAKESVTPILRLACGIFAGSIACIITQPFDVLKTTAQLYPNRYLSMITAVKILYKESGTRSLLAGFVPRLMRRTLTSALNWTVFDELQKTYKTK